MSRILVFLVIFLGVGLIIWQVATRSALAYEKMLMQRVTNSLEVLGYDWARIRGDGLRLELYGHAPDTFARDLAVETAQAAAPFASVTSYATATLAPPENRDPVRVEFLRDTRGVTMTGQTASRAMRSGLTERLKERDAALSVRDLTGIQAASPPRSWGAEVDVATLAATALANAYVVMEPGHVLIDGQASNTEERARLIGALRRAGGETVDLQLNIRIPAEVIAPFGFSADKRPGEPLRIEVCAVRDESEDAFVRAALGQIGRQSEFPVCQVGLGGPDGDWPGAVAAAIEALKALPAGRVDIEYHNVRVTGLPPTLNEDFAPVIGRLKETLPQGYALQAVRQQDDAATRTAIARDLYWMTMDGSADGVRIAGLVPDERTAVAIRAYSVAVFGSDLVKDTLRIVDAPAPRHWQIAAMGMIDQLALGRGGQIRMGGYKITVWTFLDDPALARPLHDELLRGLPDYRIKTIFYVDLPAQMAAIPMPGPSCADRLGQVHRKKLIEFSTGSARITEESAPVLDALAQVFQGCTDDPIEVGGHTDSQGAEDLNLRISQARADAVVAALVARGVSPARLVARGYGETVPVASNQSEAGRARNRRIEFQVAAPSSGVDAAEAKATGTANDAGTPPEKAED